MIRSLLSSQLFTAFLLAFFGYLAKYYNDLKIAQRKDRLERVNQQLRLLYGPLYAAAQAANRAWVRFRQTCRAGGAFFDPASPPNEEELDAWRLWMSEVFMPLNLRMEKIIVENADLFLDDEMASPLLVLCAHVAAYKPVLKKWGQGDFSENTSKVNFPPDLLDYAEACFKRLKQEQAALLGKLKQLN